MSTFGQYNATGTAGTVLAAATLPYADETNRRKGVTLTVSGAGTAFIGLGAGTALAPTTGTGFPISAATSPLRLTEQSWDAIQAIAVSGTVDVRYLAESGVGE